MEYSQDVDSIRVVDHPDKYAVLLNARARGWTGEVHAAAQRFVPSRHLFLTDDFRQARTTIDKILDDDYDVVFTGGGDGTIVYLINAIEDRIRAGEIDRDDAPPVGVLRLGTGNAIATYLNSNPLIEDLAALHAGTPLKIHRINLIEDGEHRFPFGGFGWDADILNDYDRFKKRVHGTALERLATGLHGYGVSVATKTLPKALLGDAREVTLTNRGPRAYELDEDGQIVGERGPGDVLYRGPLKITSPATIPYWGFGIRMFPFCNMRPDFFELRYYTGSAAQVVANLKGFWNGKMPSSLLGDWLVSEVHVEIADGEMSYQVAGDAAGMRSDVVWRLADHRVPLAVPMK